MGVIDDMTHTLSCPGCGIRESVKILEHGSAYGSSWQGGKQFANFSVEWGPIGVAGPRIISATCKKCGETPTVAVS
jgi:hypothetical protein